ncbi:2TM domain-containing protein [bacterium]|nr:2TM domain-containing protein [bacterium]MBU1881629.1 2TM domain-containing protein [bacterium]
MDDKEIYERARRRVEELKGFYIHLAVFIIINLGLFLFNWFTDRHHLWFIWSLFGWGIGLAIHGLYTFNFMPFLGRDWEERKIQELVDKEKQQGM